MAVQKRRSPEAEGKAEIPGAGEVIRVMSSVWRLYQRLVMSVLLEWAGAAEGGARGITAS